MSGYPERIVCLTEETTETLYLLGEGHRVVGISGYTVRPAEARQKPKSTSILQPGPAALTEGLRQLHAILGRVVGADAAGSLAPDPAGASRRDPTGSDSWPDLRDSSD